MAIKWITALLCSSLYLSAQAQFDQSTVLNGEFGVSVGAAHYFGDLNTRAALNRPKIAASLLFRKQFGSYIAVRVQGTFAQLGYSDIYSKNEVQKTRNLSFNTNIFELKCFGTHSSALSPVGNSLVFSPKKKLLFKTRKHF